MSAWQDSNLQLHPCKGCALPLNYRPWWYVSPPTHTRSALTAPDSSSTAINWRVESLYPCLSSLVDVTFTSLQDCAALVNCVLCDVCHVFITGEQQHLCLAHTVVTVGLTHPPTEEPPYQVP